jgi:predicted unusual protein kinase regulating ubiquinone biosynthesis (AarF/ABC1/UbiB family)
VPPDAIARLEALATAAMRLVRSAPTGRVVLARLHEAIDPAWLVDSRGQALARELADAHERACQPLKARDVERVLRDAWDAKPSAELDELDLAAPVAVTPIAQVHRGVREGAPVAVKVLRPGLPRSLRADLALLDVLALPLAVAAPALEVPALLAEVRERLSEELDLEHERDVQRGMHRSFRDHPDLLIPAPIGALTHEYVLVSEWVAGTPVLEASGADAARAARRVVRFAFGAPTLGLAHADLVPGNLLVADDGRLAIVDFGAARAADPARLDAARALLAAVGARDGEALGVALGRLGALPPGDGPAVLALARAVLATHLQGSSRLDADAVVAAGERLGAQAKAAAPLVDRARLNPADLWPLRGVASALGTAARIGAQEDWLALARDALATGP